MAKDTSATNTPDTSVGSSESFLRSGGDTPESNIYGDFFQETSDGSLSIGPKSQKSSLEIVTGIFAYVVPIAVIASILAAVHVFLRTQESGSFAENYQFLCPYINMGVNAEEKGCKTFTMIAKEYQDKTANLQANTIDLLTEYIPIKVSKNIMDASPEKKFVFDVFANKIHVDEIMKQFETVKRSASYVGANNIECNGLSITHGDNLATQCTIYGGSIGDDDANKRLGSSRIEALRFLDVLANTPKSHFLLLNPPSSLSTEEMGDDAGNTNDIFKTRTTLQIQLEYVPLTLKS